MISRRDRERIEGIKNDCKTCGGAGVLFISGSFQDCECIDKINKELKILTAKIPPMYSTFSLDNLKEDFKNENTASINEYKDFISNLKNNLGEIFWFYSTPGLAKSSLICWGLMQALEQGYSAYFARAPQLMQLKLDALKQEDKKDELRYILEEVDVLAIEEIDKVYLVGDNFITGQFYDLLLDLYDAKKTLLISSNLPPLEVTVKFPTYIRDRLEVAKFAELFGKSGR